MKSIFRLTCVILVSISIYYAKGNAQNLLENPELDKKVQAFLDKNEGNWHDLNVPLEDGKKLYELIIKNRYKAALEIGTSTGYSSIWIAWALSKTGGKLITIEINRERHQKAINNFKEAGLLPYIDARLADAHQLVKELKGPFDFVFSDADKNWYLQYFKDIEPKLMDNSCYVSHNVSEKKYVPTPSSYLQYLQKLAGYQTTIFDEGAGMSITFKKKEVK
ncbi:MAG: class I SAM-dependent methyltransferase [Bacteroidales bacterium]